MDPLQITPNRILRRILGHHHLAAFLVGCLVLADCVPPLRAETCTTQSQLAPAERSAIAEAARTLAADVQSNNSAGLRTASSADLAKDFGALQYLVATTAPKLAGSTPEVEQVYVLDAMNLAKNADGSYSEAQFYCSLNRSTQEAEFDITGLTPGRYAFAMVRMASATPWRLSVLLRQESPNQPQSRWLLVGLYPKPLTAAGHDGLWYWTQARQMARDKQQWNAWLYYEEAQHLLQPADFVLSSHLEKLRTETNAAAPPALSEGMTADSPLVIKGADGTEYRFTGMTVDDSPDSAAPDLAVHLRADALPDPAAARKRNQAAAAALLAAHPELRKPFHGVRVIADIQGQGPVVTEQAMADIQ